MRKMYLSCILCLFIITMFVICCTECNARQLDVVVAYPNEAVVYPAKICYKAPTSQRISEDKVPSISDKDVELIALVVMAEAEGEPELGKRMVISTILNRMDSKHFPNTIYDVLYQRSQFTCMTNGRVERCEVRDEILVLVEEELIDRTNQDVIFFSAGKYGKYGVPMWSVANHYFSKYS